MNTTTKLAIAALLGMILFSATASADVKKGQKIYLKKLKAACGFSGAKFAHKHTQDEWEEINEAGKMSNEIMSICPKLKKVKAKYVPDVYDFSYEYAKDSGNVPSC